MILTFAEDFSFSSGLDTELLAVPESGLFFNRGVHPIVTVENLLSFLPRQDISIAAYNVATTYGKFSDTRKKSDLVTSSSKIYQSIATNNVGHAVTDTNYWIETNEDSLRIKAFIWSVQDNMISALSMNRSLVENQNIYEVGRDLFTLQGDYAAWAFEPKGSDYVKIRINQMALQANTSNPVNVYVINQGILIETIIMNPSDGKFEFEDVGYVVTGKGRTIFAFPAQQVKSNRSYNEPLKYKGFVCYPMEGSGSTPEGATYKETSVGNGLSFNVSAYIDTTQFVTNNLIDLAKMFQAQFELDFATMIISNANSKTNRSVRVLSDNQRNVIYREVTVEEGNTIAGRYLKQKHAAKRSIVNSIDKFVVSDNGNALKTEYTT